VSLRMMIKSLSVTYRASNVLTAVCLLGWPRLSQIHEQEKLRVSASSCSANIVCRGSRPKNWKTCGCKFDVEQLEL
jgi:hypothetical protein